MKNLQDEECTLREDMEDIETEIENVQEDIKDTEKEITLYSLDCLIQDRKDFRSMCYKMLKFCYHFKHSYKSLEDINIKENSIQASNGCLMVEVLCEVPEDMKGKRVNIDLTKQGIIISKCVDDYPNLQPTINNLLQKEPTKKTASEWVDTILVQGKQEMKKRIEMPLVFQLNGQNIGLTKMNIVNVLSMFEENEEVEMYFDNPNSSMLFKSDKVTALIAPVKL